MRCQEAYHDLNIELEEAEQQLVKSRKVKNDMLEAQLEVARLKALIVGMENTESNLIEQVLLCIARKIILSHIELSTTDEKHEWGLV